MRSHTTKRGVWGRIHVLEGSLRYRILEPTIEEIILRPERNADEAAGLTSEQIHEMLLKPSPIR
ncbi:MAG TPA: DUF1971 domain-containing protein [Myxococcales bacterium]|nr:DUF1971 domain-containing protein [Myxococcales bacterium]HIK86450.1 DUF1971 domain-containing protein [Myxococcales bacterium]